MTDIHWTVDGWPCHTPDIVVGLDLTREHPDHIPYTRPEVCALLFERVLKWKVQDPTRDFFTGAAASMALRHATNKLKEFHVSVDQDVVWLFGMIVFWSLPNGEVRDTPEMEAVAKAALRVVQEQST